MKHFISLKNFSKNKIKELIGLSAQIKRKPSSFSSTLKGRYVGLLFQKPSLRTKTSFYMGALQLGAHALYFSPDEVQLGKREKIADVAKTLGCYFDAVVVRTFSHAIIDEFTQAGACSVVNALTDLLHPSQVLGDLLTLHEEGRDIRRLRFCYIGDGNNVCHSLLYAFSILGGTMVAATPRGFSPDAAILKECKRNAQKSGAHIECVSNPLKAAQDADVLYTDVWASMGKEKERAKRKKVFKNYRIDERIVGVAKKGCCVMHCLPAHRGEEIADSVIDGKHSVVFRQAENRLYSAKAILLYVLGGRK